MTERLSTADILMLAIDNLAPWVVCWRALGKPGPDRDDARAECAKLLREKYSNNHCAPSGE